MSLATRTEYLQKLVIDDIAQYDLGSFDADGYDFGKENLLEVREIDVARPDLLSYRAYGTMNYWWFLMWYNGINDVWNDLAPHQVLKYPDLYEVRTFLQTVKKNNELDNDRG